MSKEEGRETVEGTYGVIAGGVQQGPVRNTRSGQVPVNYIRWRVPPRKGERAFREWRLLGHDIPAFLLSK